MLKTRMNRIRLIVMSLLLVGANLSFIAPANAAPLTLSYVKLNRMKAAQTTSVRLVFKTVGAGATTASIAFNNGTYDTTTWSAASGLVNATQTISSASCAAETGATALPGSLSASGASNTISITGITSLSATTSYCVDLTSSSAVTNASAGEYHPTITVGSDSLVVAARTITDDQIVVTATVPPTFNLALSGNTDTFASNLSPSAVTVSNQNRTITVNTNAKNGWFAWAYDSNAGLSSATASSTINATTPGTGATLSTGSNGYVLGVAVNTQGSGGGTMSPAAAYSSNMTTTGSGLDTTIRQIASSTGTANGAILNIKELVSISPTQPPATDYTDTITVIGAGYF